MKRFGELIHKMKLLETMKLSSLAQGVSDEPVVLTLTKVGKDYREVSLSFYGVRFATHRVFPNGLGTYGSYQVRKGGW